MTDTSTHAAALDPEVAAALAAMPFDIGAALGSLTDETIGDVRAAMSQMPVPPLTDKVLRTDHEVPGSGGVVVRVHRPVDVKGPLPCVYWMHGGGLVLGDYAGDDARFDVWCPQLGVRRRVGAVPPVARDEVPGAARRLLRRAGVGAPACRRARRRSGARSASAGRAPAPASPPAWPCWPATRARCRWRSSC